MKRLALYLALPLAAFAQSAPDLQPLPAWHAPGMANPIIPGYFADPIVIDHDGLHYLYATIEPWGGQTLGCWQSPDFKNWTFRELNWPTKAACTSPNSGDAMVWAPSVIKDRQGRFRMYVSVGNEVWTGVADHPLGPWSNPLGDKPLIDFHYRPGFHMIDADVFVDDDGAAYIYWGSGWGWVNGACFAAKLADDYISFDGPVQNVTPANYFEGPTMLKRHGRYYLTYSNGKTISDTYEVRYAVSDHPLGPFAEGPNSPILVTDRALDVVSPGHHGFYQRGGQHYIVYHRHRIPFVEGTAYRQVCIDELRFDPDGSILKVQPTHRGPDLVQNRLATPNLANGAAVSASSSADPQLTPPARAFDDNFATRWTPDPDAPGSAWLQVDLGAPRPLASSQLRFEYATSPYAFILEASTDAQSWTPLANHLDTPAQGSPVSLPHTATARYLRLRFSPTLSTPPPSLLEWTIH